EAGEIEPFHTASRLIITRSGEIDATIRELVKTGLSYPLARSRALEQTLNSVELSTFFNRPNNILGLEYCLELARQNAPITPLTIKRTGNDYHSTELDKGFGSARAIRAAIKNGEKSFGDFLPENTRNDVKDYFRDYAPVFMDDFTDILRFLLTNMSDGEIATQIPIKQDSEIADLPDFLLNKLTANVEKARSVTQLIEAVKTKDLTYTRISRALIHLLLGITEKNYAALTENPCPYIRILGLNKTGQKYLSTLKKKLDCPLIVKPADHKEVLTADIHASDIYNLILSRKSDRETVNDYRREIIRQL
ncbi:MAG: nucleotidyltransferase family protein, partial [Alistipes sp.]|nr:nucleotidyltransferase family protein [Alistipes sp.]